MATAMTPDEYEHTVQHNEVTKLMKCENELCKVDLFAAACIDTWEGLKPKTEESELCPTCGFEGVEIK